MSVPRIAYLVGSYPAVSHTFIAREVDGLRARGVDVHTVSVRRTPPEQLLTDADRRAAEETSVILPPEPRELVGAHARTLLRRPGRYLSTLALAARLSPGGARAGLWQLFYFAEAILLWRLCRRSDIGHVHAHFASPGADVAHLYAHFARSAGTVGAGWSFTAHGFDIDNSDQDVLAAKVRDADFVVCVSNYGRGRLMALVDEDAWPKLAVIHCGVDLAAFSPPGREGPADGRLSVLSVGRLVAVKGQGVLIEAIATLARDGADVTLTLVGDGPRRPALEDLARRHGVADRVRFTGRVGQDDIRAHYSAADVFCLSSFAEGVPVVLMEAMASGIPVVATRINGIPELIEDGESGVLVAPGRADLLAAALRDMLGDGSRRAALAAAGRERVAADFEVDACAGDLRALMARYGVIDRSGADSAPRSTSASSSCHR
jgi:colanic acid/amylovoran biosynthesis glycosyltransferase